MANPYFKFKQFTVWHDKCAMKVGTDGVLLGAWSEIDHTERILDIGCGTGLISLMLAQRCDAEIYALDIDESACIQAQENADRSPFASQIKVVHQPLCGFVTENVQKLSFDCIVSNPPYFIDSLKCPDKQRNTARHTDTLPLVDLIQGSKQLLSPKGKICLVLPYDQRERLIHYIYKENLFLKKETVVYPTPSSQPKRLLVEITHPCSEETITDKLTIEKERHVYTEEFVAIAKDYYLYL